ncbi:uncharacterized protein FTOL_13449 [Fusarium torulosum]|uniref:Ankyrin n=1 Tax=Fusarium torulosum TaxID=33205 RepID=A0AAE8MPF2_9HYPO|nr:uncharacterized protein FTOL_13449 [Fusarium torulosum]
MEVDSRDNSGRSPLSWAAEGGRESIVKLLLALGNVEIDSRDYLGRTPLSWAITKRHEPIVKLLDDIASYKQSGVRASSPAVLGATSCIMVAITLRAGFEADEEPEQPRPGPSRKQRIVLITRPYDQE